MELWKARNHYCCIPSFWFMIIMMLGQKVAEHESIVKQLRIMLVRLHDLPDIRVRKHHFMEAHNSSNYSDLLTLTSIYSLSTL